MESVKIGIFSDTHGNLPAVKAILKYFNDNGCVKIFHTGDIIAMGAYSRECLDLLLKTSNVQCILGNHEYTYIHGIDHCQKELSIDEIEHQQFIHDSLGTQYIEKVKKFPFAVVEKYFDTTVGYAHYAFRGERFFKIEHNPTPAIFDEMFSNINSDIIFFGHEHTPIDIRGKKMYVDVGSVGCNFENNAKGIILTVNKDGYTYKRVNAPYDKTKFFDEMEKRKIPSREFYLKNFFGKP